MTAKQHRRTGQDWRTQLPGLDEKDGFTLHPFDERFGVRTSGLIAGRHLLTGRRNDRHATAYFAVAPSVFASLLARWRRLNPASSLEQTVFLDIGAGMGRAALLAAEMPFKEIAGIEMHPMLAGIARSNLRRWRAGGRVKARKARIVCGDAIDYPLPDAPVLAFLFNPFGPAAMKRLLKAWQLSLRRRPHPLDLVYVNNEQEDVLEAARGFTRVFAGKIARSRADAIADRRIMANQPEREYTSPACENCSIWSWSGIEDRKRSR